MAKEKKISPLYRLVEGLVRLIYPRMELRGLEKLPQGPAVIVGNHTQMNGPLVGQLYLPEPRVIWCAAPMMTLREVPGYAYQDFWSQKPRATRWWYHILSYLIAPLSVLLFNNAATIPVYRDHRMLTTFRLSLEKLKEGARVLIFPEHDVKYNNILYELEDGFVTLARMYYRSTGERLPFVPLYIAPRLKLAVFGEPVLFDPAAPIEEERKRIAREMTERITALARALPRHRVVPYRNIPKRLYPFSKEEGEA